MDAIIETVHVYMLKVNNSSTYSTCRANSSYSKDPQKLEPRVGGASTRKIRSVPGGGNIMRLRLGRRLVNLLPLAHSTD